MTNVSINDLTFGAEFEVIMPPDRGGDAGRRTLARHLSDSGIEAASESYNHRLRPHWKITTDSSIGNHNAEIVSPILQGEAGLDQIKRFCRLIDDWGCRVSRVCGHHVHVGVRDRFGQQVGFFKELLKTYGKYQPVIDQLVAPSRRNGQNGYCRAVTYTDAMDRAGTLDELARLAGAGHFTNPNFYDAFSRHGTVEFRQHQGTINGEKSANWIKLCLRLVAHAAKNDEPARDRARSEQRFVPGTPAVRDLDASPVISAELLRGRPWWLGELIIRRIADRNPRRYGTQRYDNWEHYVVGESLNQFRGRGGRIDILRHDITEGHVTIVDASRAPVITPAVTGRYETITHPEIEAVPFERPATDDAPSTLDGLMELIGASAAERSYFEERTMELNP